MTASDLSYPGCIDLVGAFWARVIDDLACVPCYVGGRLVSGEVLRALTLAWVLSDTLAYDERGRPTSFRAWCRFGGIDLDPVWFRGELLAGRRPGFLKHEEC